MVSSQYNFCTERIQLMTSTFLESSKAMSQPTTIRSKRASPKQFNFARHWRQRIAPHLADPQVVTALTLGMYLLDPTYSEGDPPWLIGRGPVNGQRVRRGCLSWYQPWGRCHHIAPFSWAIGIKLYPDLNWGFVSGELHTVAVGYIDDWKHPLWVMDILLFREMTAEESLDLVMQRAWQFCDSLPRYAATFSDDPEAAYEVLTGQNGIADQLACSA